MKPITDTASTKAAANLFIYFSNFLINYNFNCVLAAAAFVGRPSYSSRRL